MKQSSDSREEPNTSDRSVVSRRSGALLLAAVLCVATFAAPVAASISTDASYNVDYLRAPGTADAGSTITVKVDATNTGSSIGSGTVEYRIDLDGDGTLESDETLASKDIFLGRNQPETLTFRVTLDGVAAGTYKHGMVTNSDSVTESITITADSNDPPSADAGSDVTVAAGQQTSLDATRSSDPDGDSLTYSWTQVSGPSVNLVDADTVTPTFTAPDVESTTALDFQVTVDDGEATATDTVSVSVQPDDSGGNDDAVSRSLSAPKAPPGGNLTVTLTVDFENAHDGVSIKDEFTGPVVSSSLEGVYVDGERSQESVLFPGFYDSYVQLALQDIPSDATVEVVYTVNVAADATNGEVIEFTGGSESDVVAGDFEGNFGVDSATVGTPANVDRELDSAEVAPGGAVTATLEAEFDQAYPSVSIQDGFSGPTEGVSIGDVSLNGSPIDSGNVVFQNAAESGVTVAVTNVPADATVTIDYTVTVADSASTGDTISFEGADGPDVAASDLEGEFGTDTTTVVESEGPVARFDADGNGKISTEELNAAIQAWATGDLSTADLNLVIQAWATSG